MEFSTSSTCSVNASFGYVGLFSLRVTVVVSASNIAVLLAGPVSLLCLQMLVCLLTCRLPYQPEYVDPLNTYVSLDLSLSRECHGHVVMPYHFHHSFQRVMHSVLSTRIMLHVYDTAHETFHMHVPYDEDSI